MDRRGIFELLSLTKKCLNAYIKNDDMYEYKYDSYLNYEVHMVSNDKMFLLIINNMYYKDKYCCKKIDEIFNKIDLHSTENIYLVTLDDSCKFIQEFINHYHKKIKFILMLNYLNVVRKKLIINGIKKIDVKYKDIHLNYFQNLLLYHENEKILSKLCKTNF